ncbi:hypothetical protein WAE61_01725 [Comamonadaceae bacterium PP-2]
MKTPLLKTLKGIEQWGFDVLGGESDVRDDGVLGRGEEVGFEFVDGGLDEHAQTAFEIAGVQESFQLAHGAEKLLFLARGKKQGRVRQQHAGAFGLEAQSAFEVSLGYKHWISSFHATVISGGDAYALSYYECVHERIEYGTWSRDKNNCQQSLQA